MKIVIIGAGSSYTPELIEGLIKRNDELNINELVLVDIKTGESKLDIIFDLTKRMVLKVNLDWKITKTFDRIEAIKGANFVMTQIRVGGLDARIIDEKIPLSHGELGQETNGAGGLFKFLRTAPTMLEISNEIAEYAPDAWMLNFTNPAGMISELLIRYSNHKKIIGLCNVPINLRIQVAKMWDVTLEETDIDFAGLNHFVAGLKIMIKGEDKTQATIKKLVKKDVDITMNNIIPLYADPLFLTEMKVLLCPYHRYYFMYDDMLKKQLEDFNETGTTRATTVKAIEKTLFEKYQDPNLDIKPPELQERGGAYYSDVACELLLQIHIDKKTVSTVNILNGDTIKSLPADSVIEVSAYIGKEGPVAKDVGDLPEQLKGYTQHLKSFERLVINGFMEKNLDKIFLALTINPLTKSVRNARIVFDELYDAHKPFLTYFDE